MRLNHISGLKGLAIIQVVFMHLYLVLKTSLSAHGISQPPHLFVNGSFAVCLFLILSGYVISLSSDKILHLGQLLSSIVKRYFRIAVPISMIVVIAYILYLLGLYRIQELATDTNISFSVYLVHWPVICTVTCYLYYGLSKLNFITMIWINIIITLPIIVLVSILYHKFVEEKSTIVISKIMQLYNR